MQKALWLSLPLLFIALALSAEVRVQEKETPPPAVDLYGDPLPPGAVQRLGTMRFRHDPQTTGLVFSPDGKMLASAGNKIHCCLWEAATGRLLHRLPAASNCIDHMCFSPDSKMLFTGTDLQLFDVDSGKEIRQFEQPKGARHPWLVAFSPDGKTIATSVEFQGVGTIILFWDVATGKSLHRSIGYTDRLTALAYSPDGQFVAVGTENGMVHVLDAWTGKVLQGLKESKKQVWRIAFSPKNNTLAAVFLEGPVTLWDLKTGVPQQTLNHENGSAIDVYINSIGFSRDGKELVCVGCDKVHVWDPSTGKKIRQSELPFANWSAISSDSRLLASSRAFDSSIRIWDLVAEDRPNPSTSHTGPIRSLHFSTDGNTLNSLGSDRRVFDWDLATGRPRSGQFYTSPLGAADNGWISDQSDMSEDGRVVAMTIFVPSSKSTSGIHLFHTSEAKSFLSISETSVFSLKLSPRGKFLVSSGSEATCLWDVASGKQLHRILGQHLGITSAFTPDGKQVILVANDSSVRLLDIVSGKVSTWNPSNEMHPLFTLSHDGKTLACINGSAVEFRNAATGKRLARAGGSIDGEALAFSYSDRVLAVMGLADVWLENGGWYMVSRIQLFDTLTGQTICKFDGPQADVRALAFSPDGRLLASGADDSTILLWDMTDHAIPGQLGKYKEPKALTADQLKTLWADLAGDALKAEKALWTLAFAPKDSMRFLKNRMQPKPKADANEVAKLVAALDSQTYAGRQKAAVALEELGESAEAFVRKHLEGKTTLEARLRMQQFLERRDQDAIRMLRAVESVEQIDMPQARELLQMLVKDSPNPRIVEAAAGR